MTREEPPLFPRGHGSVTITTKPGRAIRVRHILPEDAALLVDLYRRLSPETRRLRFMSAGAPLPDEALWAEAMRRSHIDPLVEAALLATVPEQGEERAGGVARMARDTAKAAHAELD